MATKPTGTLYVSNTVPNHSNIIGLWMFNENTGTTSTNQSGTGGTVTINSAYNTASSANWYSASEGTAVRLNPSSQDDDYIRIPGTGLLPLAKKGTIRMRFDDSGGIDGVTQEFISFQTDTYNSGASTRFFKNTSNSIKFRFLGWTSGDLDGGAWTKGLHDLVICWDDGNDGTTTGFVKVWELGSGTAVQLVNETISPADNYTLPLDSGGNPSGFYIGAGYNSGIVNEVQDLRVYMLAVYNETFSQSDCDFYASYPYSVVQNTPLLSAPKVDYSTYPAYMFANGSDKAIVKSSSLTSGLVGLYFTSKGSTTTLKDAVTTNSANLTLTSSAMWLTDSKGHKIKVNDSQSCTPASNGSKYNFTESDAFSIAFLVENKAISTYANFDGFFFNGDNSTGYSTGAYGVMFHTNKFRAWISAYNSVYTELDPPPSTGWSLYVMRYGGSSGDNANKLKFWRFDWSQNSFYKATDATRTSQTFTTTSGLYVGRGGIATTTGMQTSFCLMGIWNRCLSDSECDTLGDNPFQIGDLPKSTELNLYLPGSDYASANYNATRESIYYTMYIGSGYSTTNPTVVSIHGTESDNDISEMGISINIATDFDDPVIRPRKNWGTIADQESWTVVCPRVWTSGHSVSYIALGAANYGRGAADANTYLDYSNIKKVLACLDFHGFTGDTKYLSGHSSGGALADTIGMFDPETFSKVCLNHGSGLFDPDTPGSADELTSAQTNGNRTLVHMAQKYSWGSVEGHVYGQENLSSPGTYLYTTQGAADGSGTFDWQNNATAKANQFCLINAEYDGASAPWPVGVARSADSYTHRNELMITILTSYGYSANNIRQIIYTPPEDSPSNPGYYDDAFTCRVKNDNWPYHCHAKNRELVAGFFRDGFSFFDEATGVEATIEVVNSQVKSYTFTVVNSDATTIIFEFRDEKVSGNSFRIDTTNSALLNVPYIISMSLGSVQLADVYGMEKFSVIAYDENGDIIATYRNIINEINSPYGRRKSRNDAGGADLLETTFNDTSSKRNQTVFASNHVTTSNSGTTVNNDDIGNFNVTETRTVQGVTIRNNKKVLGTSETKTSSGVTIRRTD